MKGDQRILTHLDQTYFHFLHTFFTRNINHNRGVITIVTGS